METNKVPTMKIQIEFLASHTSVIHQIARVPCVGERVCSGIDAGMSFVVKDVTHVLGASVDTDVVAIVRVA